VFTRMPSSQESKTYLTGKAFFWKLFCRLCGAHLHADETLSHSTHAWQRHTRLEFSVRAAVTACSMHMCSCHRKLDEHMEAARATKKALDEALASKLALAEECKVSSPSSHCRILDCESLCWPFAQFLHHSSWLCNMLTS
jgi:hypothetical protein